MLKEWEIGKLEIPDEIYDKIMNFPTEPLFKNRPLEECRFTQIDLFAGIGGIRQPFQKHGGYNVYSSEWDKFAQTTYRINYGEIPDGDITLVNEKTFLIMIYCLQDFLANHFHRQGFIKALKIQEELSFDIARILNEKDRRHSCWKM